MVIFPMIHHVIVLDMVSSLLYKVPPTNQASVEMPRFDTIYYITSVGAGLLCIIYVIFMRKDYY
jgi:hypothetical protein